MTFDNTKKRSKGNKLHGGHVWGLRVDERISNGCVKVAAFIGVPIGMLVSYMFIGWVKTHDHLLQDNESVRELARRVRAVDEGLRGGHSMHHMERSTIDDEEMTNLAVPWTVRGINLTTRMRIKALARNDQITVSKLIDKLVSKEWKARSKEMAAPGLSGVLGKDIKKILNYAAKRGSYTGKKEAYDEVKLGD